MFHVSNQIYDPDDIFIHDLKHMNPRKPIDSKKQRWTILIKWIMDRYMLNISYDFHCIPLDMVPSGNLLQSYWKWPIDIVDLPVEHGDFPSLCKHVPGGKPYYPLKHYGWFAHAFLSRPILDFVQNMPHSELVNVHR